jgi:sterol desaturase/sphingolipid hydroxylase (fatty acid hydroxylase superfamily)
VIFNDFGKKCPTLWDLCNPAGTIVGDFRHEGPIYVFMVMIVVGGRYYLKTSGVAYIFIIFGLTVMGVIGNAMHISFHIRGFELEKYEWYMELRMLHYIHHLGDMKSNLAMVNLGMDGLFNSLLVDDPDRKRKMYEGMPLSEG